MIVIIVVLGIILLAAVFAVFSLYRAAESMGMGSVSVADYDKKISIWNQAAGNHSASKLDDMDINYRTGLFSSTLKFAKGIVGEEYRDIEQDVDTFTYLYEIKRGYEKETYEDEPYIIPYPAKNNESAVLVIPGGGFGYKSMDGTTGEGKEVAAVLQKNGINAFVLHYRSNPYEYPIPQLDVQRAVRYLRYHAEEFGIHPDKISMIGYSAGGTAIGSFVNQIQGKNVFPEGYITDEVDHMDDKVTAVAMIYPCLTYQYNVSMLYCSFDAEEVRDEERRQELLQFMDLPQQFDSADVKQFIAYGTSDTMVKKEGTIRYIEAAKKAGTDIRTVIADGQPHGFKQAYYMEEYLDWMKSLFCTP